MAFQMAPEDLRLLAEIGFLGIGHGRHAEAGVIFSLIRSLRPDLEAGHVGGALCEVAAGRLVEAAALLRVAPQTEAIMAFRALVHGQAGDRSLAQEILSDLGFMKAGPQVMEIAGSAAEG